LISGAKGYPDLMHTSTCPIKTDYNEFAML